MLTKEIENIESYLYLSEGKNAKVFVYKDNLLKLYKYDCTYKSMISKSMFKTLKEIENKNFVDLGEIVYREKERLFIDGYTMKKVDGDKIDLIEADTEYFLEMMHCLDNLADEFTRKRIIMYDTHEKNIIFTENNVTVIDPDKFFKSIRNKKNIFLINKLRIMEYINCTLMSDYINNNHRNMSEIMLPNHEIRNNTDLSYYYSKRLVKKKLKDNFKDVP